MKKALFVLCYIIIAEACNNNNADKSKVDTTPNLSQTNNSVEILVDTLGYNTGSADKKFEKGSNLIIKSDCLTCHKIKEKNVGPAYVAIAEKYPPTAENISYLSSKIIKGGKGVWGEVPMLPHASLSEADAKEMVQYILSLKVFVEL